MVGAPFLAVFKAKWRDDAAEISPAFFSIFLLNNKKNERKQRKNGIERKVAGIKREEIMKFFLFFFFCNVSAFHFHWRILVPVIVNTISLFDFHFYNLRPNTNYSHLLTKEFKLSRMCVSLTSG